jgi:hypothetical protein
MTEIYIAVALTTGMIAFVGFFFGVHAIIEVKAMQRSTHTIVKDYAPVDDIFEEADDIETEKEVNAAIAKAEDVFAGLRE